MTDEQMIATTTVDAPVEAVFAVLADPARYDLVPTDDHQTDVTLTYDWSAVPQELREQIQFPPFDAAHLKQSLGNLVRLATER